MNWKRFFLTAMVMFGFAFAAASRSEAGTRFNIGIGIGAPLYHAYPAYHSGCYARPYPYYYRSAPVVGVRYYWHNGRRVYHGGRHYRHRHFRGCGHRW